MSERDEAEAARCLQTIVDELIGPRETMPIDELISEIEAALHNWRNSKTQKETKMNRKPIILCCGQHGRALIFGLVDSEPSPREPVTLHDARMILRFDVHGLLGLAAKGPAGDTRLTHAVPRVVETVWQEWIECTPDGAAAIAGAEPWS